MCLNCSPEVTAVTVIAGGGQRATPGSPASGSRKLANFSHAHVTFVAGCRLVSEWWGASPRWQKDGMHHVGVGRPGACGDRPLAGGVPPAWPVSSRSVRSPKHTPAGG